MHRFIAQIRYLHIYKTEMHESTIHPEEICYTWKKGHYFTTDLCVWQNFHLPHCSPLPAFFHQQPVSSLTPPRNRYSSNTPCNTINYFLVVKRTTRRLNPSKINGGLDGSCNFLLNWMCEQLQPSYLPTQLQMHLQSLPVFQKDELETVRCLCTLWNIWRHWLTSSLGMWDMLCSHHTWQRVTHASQWSHWHMPLRRDQCQHHSPPAAPAVQCDSH